ncbi:inosine-uridine preferring nucleoside hydrolase [Nematostella vectensis]|uniref:inosine-uridine preferring nucleoside hydrolase n=1 Tax=Nematostella vectensis TaxID=45351 RepID=UPI002076DF93|nr:inosine-uridine preferring nucleoside hydrolase [Nematostella vectensis]
MADSRPDSQRPKVIIDCDVGIDDAQAIFIALSQNVDVVAITCVAGNVEIGKVSRNCLRVLDVCGRTDIPVYKGATKGLLGHTFDLPGYHGVDGLGDATDAKEPDLTLLQKGHAVSAMLDIVRKLPGEVTIIALAPLTNLALACRMDPEFSRNLKAIYMMGGNHHGVGNHFISAEFNFGVDPEAAFVVLNEFKCPMTIITWEFCQENPVGWEFFNHYIDLPTKKSQFIKSISGKVKEFEKGGPWLTCDPFAVAVAVCPNIVKKAKMVHATIELEGKVTRGQMVVDWRGVLKKDCNVRLVEEVDLEMFKALLIESVQY